MDFATIGKLGTYVKQKNLMFAAKHKIQTGQSLTNANGNLRSMTTSTFEKLREAAKASTDQAKQQKLRRIKQKLKAGQKLTDEELGFLRVNDPKTYKKAKYADDAREELKSELKKAKSKSEAREAMTRAMVKASADAMAELSALGQGGGSALSGNLAGFSGENAANCEISGGENISAGSNGEISAENASNTENSNENAQNAQKSNENGSNSAQNSDGAQKNSDEEKNSFEDIMEKYIWTIRALQDEWARFTDSDEYKNLPEHTIDGNGKKINRNLLKAAAVYRKTMIESMNIA